MTPKTDSTPTLAKRLLWFVALWTTSVTALAVIAYGIRWALLP